MPSNEMFELVLKGTVSAAQFEEWFKAQMVAQYDFGVEVGFETGIHQSSM